MTSCILEELFVMCADTAMMSPDRGRGALPKLREGSCKPVIERQSEKDGAHNMRTSSSKANERRTVS
jgi:hypothetical protein